MFIWQQESFVNTRNANYSDDTWNMNIWDHRPLACLCNGLVGLTSKKYQTLTLQTLGSAMRNPFLFHDVIMHLGLYSLSGRTSYHTTSLGLEAARLDVLVNVSLWNLTDISAVLLLMCLPNVRATGRSKPEFPDFTRSCDKIELEYTNLCR